MMQSLKERFDREDEGFTLIELMVVVLIIAILLAIAIPTFLGARDSANARAAQSDLRNADTAEQTYWTNNQAWDVAPNAATTGSVANTETSLTWSTTGPVTPGNNVLVTSDVTANNGVIMTAASKNGHCYSVEVVDQPLGTTGTAPAGTFYFDGGAGSAASGCSAPTVALGSSGAGTYTSAANSPSHWASAF